MVLAFDIPYNKRVGKSKVRLVKDSLKSMRYILEAGIYYNPLKIYTLLTSICIVFSIIGFLFSHFMNIKAGYILGIGRSRQYHREPNRTDRFRASCRLRECASSDRSMRIVPNVGTIFADLRCWCHLRRTHPYRYSNKEYHMPRS